MGVRVQGPPGCGREGAEVLDTPRRGENTRVQNCSHSKSWRLDPPDCSHEETWPLDPASCGHEEMWKGNHPNCGFEETWEQYPVCDGDREHFSSEINEDDRSDLVRQGVHVSQNILPKECDLSSSFSHPSSTPRRLSAPLRGFYHNSSRHIEVIGQVLCRLVHIPKRILLTLIVTNTLRILSQEVPIIRITHLL